MGRSRPPRWLEAARAQNRSPPPPRSAGPRADPLDWLSRALARAGVLPTAEAERAIHEGRVKVNGKVQRQPLAASRLGDRVTLDGHAVSLRARTRALMLHKPEGVVTAGSDPEGRGTVFEVLARALPPELRSFGWHGIGRLDRNTTGLLLFTNDERLVAHVTSPETHLPKRYLARVSAAATDTQLEPLRQGVTLDDGPARPALARLRQPGLVELTLTEGRNHQVKRMLAAVGLPVLALHREAVGSLTLDVPTRAVRPLSDDEVRQALGFEIRATPEA